jgi:hypothetical protein
MASASGPEAKRFLAAVKGETRGQAMLDKPASPNSVRALLVRSPAEAAGAGSAFSNLIAALGDRLMVGQRILAPLIKVRILVPQPPVVPRTCD